MKKGFSLVELLVAMGIVALLVGLSVPAINALQKSYDSTGADSMISAALSTARTLAISNHNYAGVRFQKAGDPNNAVKADQYMVFMIYEEPKNMGNLTDAFRAIEGYKPIKLPANIGVIDMTNVTLDTDINGDIKLFNAATFSIIFSPAGKLVIHLVQTRSYKNLNSVFNTDPNVGNGTAMFVQDNAQEASRSKFVIYDRSRFDTLAPSERYSKYLGDLKINHSIFINPYTGQLIEK